MTKRIDIETFLSALAGRPLLDARTPAEYAQGHIPGAHSLPLFDDEERAIVGTLYKHEGPEKALQQGLEFVGPKMRHFVEEAGRLAPSGKVAVHCWRGGKRSDSLAWLLDFAGFDVMVLEGGYKAYRRYLLDWFSLTSFELFIVGGYTGSGKTEMIRALAGMGEQTVDLEGLACHKGSAFGALGESPQPSVEQFENDLFDAFRRLDAGRRVWLEDESQAIGRVYIPDGLWRQMLEAPLLRLHLPFAMRVERLVAGYAHYPKEQLIVSFDKIRKRLGGQHHQAAVEALNKGDYALAAALALRYYDKSYAHSHIRRDPATIISLPFEENDPAKAAALALDLVRRKGW